MERIVLFLWKPAYEKDPMKGVKENFGQKVVEGLGNKAVDDLLLTEDACKINYDFVSMLNNPLHINKPTP